MELAEVLNYCLYIVLTVLLPVVAKYAVDLIKTKIKESTIIEEAAKNENISNLIKDALSDVMDAVLYVNQTFVDTLKAKGEFTKEAWETAKRKHIMQPYLPFQKNLKRQSLKFTVPLISGCSLRLSLR